MSLFDQMLGGLIGQLGGGQQKNALLDLAASVIQNQPGGLSGLVQRFSQAGFGDQVKSWVSSGANLPISTDQLTSVLGQANIEAMSQKLGVSAKPSRRGWPRSCRTSSTSSRRRGRSRMTMTSREV
jgi:uncharacterized protein YidB (DUF937 family)